MRFVVGILGLEPRMTGPESVVLPLHHIPMLVLRCKVTTFFVFRKRFTIFFFASFYTFYKAEKLCKRVRNNMGKTIIFTIMHS